MDTHQAWQGQNYQACTCTFPLTYTYETKLICVHNWKALTHTSKLIHMLKRAKICKNIYMLLNAQHKVIITSHILCVPSVGTPIYLHPADCSQVRQASNSVRRSVAGSRLPAALTPCGFGMSWTPVAFTLLDHFTSTSLLYWLLLRWYSRSPAKEILQATPCNFACLQPQIAAQRIMWSWILQPDYFIHFIFRGSWRWRRLLVVVGEQLSLDETAAVGSRKQKVLLKFDFVIPAPRWFTCSEDTLTGTIVYVSPMFVIKNNRL